MVNLFVYSLNEVFMRFLCHLKFRSSYPSNILLFYVWFSEDRRYMIFDVGSPIFC